MLFMGPPHDPYTAPEKIPSNVSPDEFDASELAR